MSSAIGWGILAAVSCALIGNVAALIKFKAVQEVPCISLSNPWVSFRALLKSKAWLMGFALATTGFMFNALALALAPLSIVKPVLAGGVVLLALLAERMLGVQPGRKQLAALLLAAGGLIAFAVTSPGTSNHLPGKGLLEFELAAMLAVAVFLLLSKHRPALFLATAAGILMGAADAAVKQMGMTGLGSWFEGPAFYALMGALAALLIASKALQIGEAIGTVAVIGVASNLTAMLAGYTVFQDQLPADGLAAFLHLAALAAVLAGMLLVPGPRPSQHQASED